MSTEVLILTIAFIQSTFRMSKSTFITAIQGLKMQYYEYLMNTDNHQEVREMVYNNDRSITNVKTSIRSKIKYIENTLTNEVIKATHKKYRANIISNKKIPKDKTALAFQRASVNKGFKLKQGLAAKSNEAMAIAQGYKPHSIKLVISGYNSPLLAILQLNTHIKAVFVESVDRLSRNMALTIDLLDYCSLHDIQIYVGSSIMNRGIGRCTLLLLAVFAEFELTAKQTSFSEDLLNVIKFELKVIEFGTLSDSEKKLFNNLQFVEKSSVYEKAIALSEKYTFEYDHKVLNKAGKRKANNIKLYDNAKKILSLLV